MASAFMVRGDLSACPHKQVDSAPRSCGGLREKTPLNFPWVTAGRDSASGRDIDFGGSPEFSGGRRVCQLSQRRPYVPPMFPYYVPPYVLSRGTISGISGDRMQQLTSNVKQSQKSRNGGRQIGIALFVYTNRDRTSAGTLWRRCG